MRPSPNAALPESPWRDIGCARRDVTPAVEAAVIDAPVKSDLAVARHAGLVVGHGRLEVSGNDDLGKESVVEPFKVR